MRIVLIAAYGLCMGCATVDLPNLGSQGAVLEDDEKRLYNRARETVEYLDNNGVIYPDPELEAYLTNVARALLPEGLRDTVIPELDIQVKVINDPDMNAISLPNGRIYFHTGMLAVMENEAELATVMAHELVHVLNRHVLKEKRSTENKAAFFNATLGGVFPLAYHLGTLSSVSGFSRKLELEADEQGFELLARGGYEVKESAKVFEKIKIVIEEEKIKLPFFFSTHPHVVARVNNYRKLIEATPSRAGKINETEFQRLTQRMFFDTLTLWMRHGRFKSAERYIDKYLGRNPSSAEGFYVKGEICRQRQDPLKGADKRDKIKDYETALQAYEKAIEYDPGLVLVYQGKGKVLRLMGRDTEAKKAFEKYLEMAPQASDRDYIKEYLDN